MNITVITSSVHLNHVSFQSFYKIGSITVVGIISVLVCFANFAQFKRLHKERFSRSSRRYNYSLYLLNLNIVALVCSITLGPGTVAFKLVLHNAEFTVALRKLLSCIQTLLTGVCVWTIVFMIRNLKQNMHKKISVNRIKYNLYFIWLCCLIFSIPRLFFDQHVYWLDVLNRSPSLPFKIYFAATFVMLFKLPFAIVAYSKVKISRQTSGSALLLHQRRMYASIGSFTIWILFVYSICNLPIFLTELVHSLFGDRKVNNLEKLYEPLLYFSWIGHLMFPLVYYLMFTRKKKRLNIHQKQLCQNRMNSNLFKREEDLILFFKSYCNHLLIDTNYPSENVSTIYTEVFKDAVIEQTQRASALVLPYNDADVKVERFDIINASFKKKIIQMTLKNTSGKERKTLQHGVALV